MSELNVGDIAPDFDLASDTTPVRLSELRGKTVVLFFYPKDDTTGCTAEAIAFSELKAEFAAADTIVVGASKDSVKSHAKFRQKHNLSVELASDPTGETIERYGAWVEKSMYGRQYMGIERSTFLIDRDGVIQKVWRKVKVPGHAAEVLEAARALLP